MASRMRQYQQTFRTIISQKGPDRNTTPVCTKSGPKDADQKATTSTVRVTLVPVEVALSLANSWRLSVRKCSDRKRTHDWPFLVSPSDALTRLLLTPSRYIAVNDSMCGSILLVVCSSVWPDKTTYIGQDNNDMLLERMVCAYNQYSGVMNIHPIFSFELTQSSSSCLWEYGHWVFLRTLKYWGAAIGDRQWLSELPFGCHRGPSKHNGAADQDNRREDPNNKLWVWMRSLLRRGHWIQGLPCVSRRASSLPFTSCA